MLDWRVGGLIMFLILPSLLAMPHRGQAGDLLDIVLRVVVVVLLLSSIVYDFVNGEAFL